MAKKNKDQEALQSIVVDGDSNPVSNKKETKTQVIKYIVCALSAGVIEFISFAILLEVLPLVFPHEIGSSINFIIPQPKLRFISVFVSLALSILWNFTVNRKFTFKSAGNVPRAMFLAFLFYVPFFPFALWFTGAVPELMVAGLAATAGVTAFAYVTGHQFFVYFADIIKMLLNGIFEFCWQKFFIYRKETNSALLKYAVGTIGEFGEITPAKQMFSGEEVYQMLHEGLDINALSEKQMKKWLVKQQ